jgi:hypothetical protein
MFKGFILYEKTKTKFVFEDEQKLHSFCEKIVSNFYFRQNFLFLLKFVVVEERKLFCFKTSCEKTPYICDFKQN